MLLIFHATFQFYYTTRFCFTRRQCGRVVRPLDLQFAGPESSPALACKLLLVWLRPVGNLNPVMLEYIWLFVSVICSAPLAQVLQILPRVNEGIIITYSSNDNEISWTYCWFAELRQVINMQAIEKLRIHVGDLSEYCKPTVGKSQYHWYLIHVLLKGNFHCSE